MKLTLTYLVFAVTVLLSSCKPNNLHLKDGDIIFHTSRSSQSKAIQLVTKSKYSHMGIILTHNGKQMVYEAVGPVQFTPITSWTERGEGGHFVVKRLKNADSILTSKNTAKLDSVAALFKGKPYDLLFEWSDEKLYCSELVWKMFDRALNIQIGELQKLGDFDLSNPLVQDKMKERYGDAIPLRESVISPEQMFQSSLLETVCQE